MGKNAQPHRTILRIPPAVRDVASLHQDSEVRYGLRLWSLLREVLFRHQYRKAQA